MGKKNNKLDEFNRDYYFVETYMKSFILLNMIKESVFNNDDLEFKKYTKRGADDFFYKKVDTYLKEKGCVMSSYELFFLLDILFYKRNNRHLSRSFKEKPPYFYKAFDELHNNILPILFDKNSTAEQIN